MNEIAKGRKFFLSKVEQFSSGDSLRFAPVVDELIQWSRDNGLEFVPNTGVNKLLTFSIPGTGMAFWVVTPLVGDGAKIALLGDPKFPEPLRSEARNELAEIGKKKALAKSIPELAFAKLIWAPYRAQILTLMTRLLKEVQNPVPECIAAA